MKISRKISLLLSAIMLLSFASCSNQQTTADFTENGKETTSNATTETQPPTTQSWNDTASDSADFEIEINDNEASVVKYIGEDANVVIPNSFYGHTVTSVDKELFVDNQVASVKIPNTVKELTGTDEFKNGSYNNRQIKVEFEKPIEPCPSTDFEYTISGGGVKLTAYKGNSVNLLLPEEIDGIPVTELDAHVFDKEYSNFYCDIIAIHLPSTLTTINHETFSYLYDVTSLTLPVSIKNVKDEITTIRPMIDDYMFCYNTLNTIIGSEKMINKFNSGKSTYVSSLTAYGVEYSDYEYYTEIIS